MLQGVGGENSFNRSAKKLLLWGSDTICAVPASEEKSRTWFVKQQSLETPRLSESIWPNGKALGW